MSLWLLDDGEFSVADVNEAGCEFMGREREAMIGIALRDGSGDDAERARVDMMRALARSGTVRREVPSVEVNGSERSVELMYVAVGDDAVLAFAFDISARVGAERRLRQTENRFRAVVAAANEGIWLADPDGRATFVNARAAAMLGMSADEVVGKRLSDFTVGPEVPLWPSVRAELRLKRADGSHLDVIASTSEVQDDLGEVSARVALLSDVTPLKRELAELREGYEQFEHLYDKAPLGVVFLGAGRSMRGRILSANAAFEELVGYHEDELLALDIWSLTHPHDLDHERSVAEAMFDHHRPGYEVEKRLVRADGSFVWIRFRVHLLRDDRGAPLYAIGVATDISGERAAFARAAHATARRHALFDTTSDAVLEVDADGTIVDASRVALRRLGLDHDEVAGHALNEILDSPAPHTVSFGLGEEQHTLVYLESGNGTASTPAPAPETPHEPLLSYRERQVLTLLAKGLDGPAIAERLRLAPETVRSYTQTAREKTGAKTRTEAVVQALIQGEITL